MDPTVPEKPSHQLPSASAWAPQQASAYAGSLTVRERADRRVVAGAIACGAAFDIAAHSGLATIAGTSWLVIASAAIIWGGRVRGSAGRLLLVAAPVLGLILTFRTSPWVIAPTTVAIAFLLLAGVALGADGTGPSVTFPALGIRLATAIGHVYLAPGMFRPDGRPATGAASKRLVAIARGALLSAPLILTVGALLAWADPIFRSWFDLTAILEHLALIVTGAWLAVGLARAASAKRPSPALPSAPALGTVEASVMLGGLCALYAAFVGAQFVALSAGGRYVLQTHGLTYAQYARSGFFQLLACAGITLLVLLGVRACADPSHRVVTGLCGLTVVLTIGVVVVAIRRLQLYEAAFGLTMLRLACLVAAFWIGVVFAVLGATLFKRGLARKQFPAALIVSGLVIICAWGIGNPAAVVAQTNLRRAEHGQHLDVGEVARLGPDAIPALVASLPRLDLPDAAELRRAICAQMPRNDAGPAFNVSAATADSAIADTCSPQER